MTKIRQVKMGKRFSVDSSLEMIIKSPLSTVVSLAIREMLIKLTTVRYHFRLTSTVTIKRQVRSSEDVEKPKPFYIADEKECAMIQPFWKTARQVLNYCINGQVHS